MALGNDPAAKGRNKPEFGRKASSPVKVYRFVMSAIKELADKVFYSRASKPSAVDPITTADADDVYGEEERDLINEMKAKINELIEALKH